MNTFLEVAERQAGGPVAEPDWPRDFGFREAYAEQRELLEAPCASTETLTASEATRSNE